MIRRIGILLLLLPLGSLALVFFAPSVPEAAAQNDGARRDDGEGGGGRGGRGGRGRFGGEAEGGGGRGRGRFGGGGENGGEGRGFFRRGGEGPGGRVGENSGSDRSQRSSGPSSPSSSERSSGSSGSGSNLSMENYVRGVVKEHDKNGDMMLQADEQRGLSGKAAAADTDKDGVITTNELVTALSGNAPANPPSASSGGSREGSGDSQQSLGDTDGASTTRVYMALTASEKTGSSTASDADKRRTYRFTRGADRLPATGLPSWFKSRDANADGQVAMSEYGRTWSDRTVAEFRRYDLNDDGIVTAKEATGK